MERAHRTDYLVGADQNLVPDWLVKITFLGKVETVIKSYIKPRFGIMGFNTLMPFWACGFLFNIRNP